MYLEWTFSNLSHEYYYLWGTLELKPLFFQVHLFILLNPPLPMKLKREKRKEKKQSGEEKGKKEELLIFNRDESVVPSI